MSCYAPPGHTSWAASAFLLTSTMCISAVTNGSVLAGRRTGKMATTKSYFFGIIIINVVIIRRIHLVLSVPPASGRDCEQEEASSAKATLEAFCRSDLGEYQQPSISGFLSEPLLHWTKRHCWWKQILAYLCNGRHSFHWTSFQYWGCGSHYGATAHCFTLKEIPWHSTKQNIIKWHFLAPWWQYSLLTQSETSLDAHWVDILGGKQSLIPLKAHSLYNRTFFFFF